MPKSLWKHPDFLKLWTGQTISELGSTVTRDAIPLLAVLVLNATPVEMGVLAALEGLPVLLLGIFAGVWVDRLRRRPLMILADLGRAALLALIPLAAWLGLLRIELLYALVIVTGLLGVFFNTAYRAYLPTLVERTHLVEGNSKLALSSSLAEIGGSGLAGVLVQSIGAPLAMLLDAFSFVISAVSLAWIRQPEPQVAAQKPGEIEKMRTAKTQRAQRREKTKNQTLQAGEQETSLVREAWEGVREVAGQPVLRALLGATATLNFLGSFIGPLYGLYAIRELGIGPAALGLTIAVGGISSLGGALLAEGVLRRLGLRNTLIGSLGLYSLTTLLIPLGGSFAGLGFAFLLVSQLLGDALRTIYSIHALSLRQAITPDRLLGRVNASLELVSDGIAPLGALVGGALAALLGIQAALFVASLNGVLACLWIVCTPNLAPKAH